MKPAYKVYYNDLSMTVIRRDEGGEICDLNEGGIPCKTYHDMKHFLIDLLSHKVITRATHSCLLAQLSPYTQRESWIEQ